MTDAKLKSYVDRIERLDGEQQTVGLDKRSVYDEAKAAGYDKKALRRLIAERKREDKDAATIAKVEEYRALLAMPGATVRSVAAQVGTSKTKVQRLVPKKDSGTPAIVNTDLTVINEPPHAPETGVIIEDAAPGVCVDGIPAPTVAAPVVPHASTLQTAEVGALPVTPVPDGGVGAGTIPDAVARALVRDTMLAMEEAAVPTPSVGAIAEPSAAQRVASPEPDPWIAADEARARLDESKRAKGFA